MNTDLATSNLFQPVNIGAWKLPNRILMAPLTRCRASEGMKEPRLGPMMKKEFGGAFIANQRLEQRDAETLIDSGEADAIAWGQLFIANPDLPHRFLTGAELNQPNSKTFYADGHQGYTDYPCAS